MSKFVFCIVLISATVKGYNYIVTPENGDFFRKCPGYEGRDIDTIIDRSNLTITERGNAYHVEGSYKVLFDDMAPTDRLEFRVVPQLYRFGRWTPTTLNMLRKDTFKTLFDEHEMWYKLWFNHVYEEDQKNATKGSTMRCHPFDIEAIVRNVPGPDCSGRFRILVYFTPYDKFNVKKANLTYCFAVILEAERYFD